MSCGDRCKGGTNLQKTAEQARKDRLAFRQRLEARQDPVRVHILIISSSSILPLLGILELMPHNTLCHTCSSNNDAP